MPRELVDASLVLSYDLLPPELQELWTGLSVFPDPFDLMAAAAVWGLEPERAQDRLGDLINYSLVEYNEESLRYGLHDLLRLSADSRLKASGRIEAEHRHSQHFRDVLVSAGQLYLEGGERLNQGLATFDREWPNIQAGQNWAKDHTESDANAAGLCSTYPGSGSGLGLRLFPRDQAGWLEAGVFAARRIQDRAS